MVFLPTAVRSPLEKVEFVYVGPYTVLRKISELTYDIQKSRKNKPIIVHIDKLKLCVKNDSDRSPDVTHKDCVCLLQEAAMESSSSEERPSACAECPRKFKRKFDLNRHEQDKHLKEPAAEDKRAFACSHCSSSFKRLFDLERHDLAKHLRVRVICPICEASLSSEGILRRHLKTVHPTTSKPSETFEEAREATASPSPDKGVTVEVEASESVLIYRVREQPPEEIAVPLIEAEASSMLLRASPSPRVAYERDEGYNTLARVDPALAFVNRSIRFLDLRPTTPEADEVKLVLERWRMRILNSPFPLDEAALMDQFRTEEREAGYVVALAAEQMIAMRVAVESRQTAARLATRESLTARSVSARKQRNPRTCTHSPAKNQPRARLARFLGSRQPGTSQTGSTTDNSTMSFRALKDEAKTDLSLPAPPGAVEQNKMILEISSSNAKESQPEPDHFVWENDMMLQCEEEL